MQITNKSQKPNFSQSLAVQLFFVLPSILSLCPTTPYILASAIFQRSLLALRIFFPQSFLVCTTHKLLGAFEINLVRAFCCCCCYKEWKPSQTEGARGRGRMGADVTNIGASSEVPWVEAAYMPLIPAWETPPVDL